VSDLLKVSVDIDNTPSIIEGHINEEILFIEVAQGLNKEKIEMLKYKIAELFELYEVAVPKVLILMTSVELTAEDSIKLNAFLSTILDSTRAKPRHVKILTNSAFVRSYVQGRPDFAEIEVTNNLERAMETLVKSGAGGSAQAKVIGAAAPRQDKQESIQLRFEGERAPAPELSDFGDSMKIAVIDDDMIIQELVKTAFSDTRFQVLTFDNGSLFVNSKDLESFDIVFLDLMMPVMDGFTTLEELKKKQMSLPIIVLSAITQRETVVKALSYGVKSYLTKPLKPELVRKKATEILRVNF
jgi:CheY-like chemotaxis protein